MMGNDGLPKQAKVILWPVILFIILFLAGILFVYNQNQTQKEVVSTYLQDSSSKTAALNYDFSAFHVMDDISAVDRKIFDLLVTPEQQSDELLKSAKDLIVVLIDQAVSKAKDVQVPDSRKDAHVFLNRSVDELQKLKPDVVNFQSNSDQKNKLLEAIKTISLNLQSFNASIKPAVN